MGRFIVTALGKDRPGIVAGVAEILYRLGCNLEDSAMTRLGGEFAIMLLFAAPGRVTPEALRKAFAPLEHRLSLAIHLKRLAPSERRAPSRRGRAYTLSLYGADRPGIVFRVADALAHAGVNITDLQTRYRAGAHGQRPLYLVLLDVEIPRRVSIAALERTLRQVGQAVGVEVSLRSDEAAVL